MWRPVGFHGQHRNRRPSAYLLLLIFQQVARLEYKPPVTIGIILANFAVFFNGLLPVELQRMMPSTTQGCLQPYDIVVRGQWSRLLWSAFLHADESHIYYNMTSLLWKGVQLERLLGSARFAALVGELLVLSHGLVLVGSWALSSCIPEYRYLYASTCAVGFSAVLFALKMVLNHRSSTYSDVMGFQLPTKYLAWAELVLASAFNPQASFFGHLCGILAGCIHVWAAELTGSLLAPVGRRWRQLRRITRQQQPRFAAAGSGHSPAAAPHRRQNASSAAATDDDQAAASSFRQRQYAANVDRTHQLRQGQPPAPAQPAAAQTAAARTAEARTAEAGAATTGGSPQPLSAEELRLRRLARFS